MGTFTLLTTVYWELLSLTVYRKVLKKPVTAALLELLKAAVAQDPAALCAHWGHLCAVLAERDSLHTLAGALAKEVLTDENPFTAGQPLSAETKQAVIADLRILYRAAALSPSDFTLPALLTPWGTLPAPAPLDQPWEKQMDTLAAYHARHGCGPFLMHTAFLWQNGAPVPVSHPDPIRLSDLKGYTAQRRVAIDNTRAFLDGLEANNMLLYGDRGTGKSSTVKALLNEFAPQGLRMIELTRKTLPELPALTTLLAGLPMKFVVFLDDLSFAGDDTDFATLKAVLEGGLTARPANVLLYATSNRRHLLRETFADRQGDEVHHADTVQEAVSLSDRFGISLTFLMPDKQRFLDIVSALADDHALAVDKPTLFAAAERWATLKGARSPRYARQFIADAAAKLARGEQL